MVEGPMSQPTHPHPGAPIIIERYGKAYRVHSDDETHEGNSEKFQLIIKAMGVGSRAWVRSNFATSAIPEILRTMADAIKGRGYSVILRT